MSRRVCVSKMFKMSSECRMMSAISVKNIPRSKISVDFLTDLGYDRKSSAVVARRGRSVREHDGATTRSAKSNRDPKRKTESLPDRGPQNSALADAWAAPIPRALLPSAVHRQLVSPARDPGNVMDLPIRRALLADPNVLPPWEDVESLFAPVRDVAHGGGFGLGDDGGPRRREGSKTTTHRAHG